VVQRPSSSFFSGLLGFLGFRVGQPGISFIAIAGLQKATNDLLLLSLGKILLNKEEEKNTPENCLDSLDF
jgi:hypothetical protein